MIKLLIFNNGSFLTFFFSCSIINFSMLILVFWFPFRSLFFDIVLPWPLLWCLSYKNLIDKTKTRLIRTFSGFSRLPSSLSESDGLMRLSDEVLQKKLKLLQKVSLTPNRASTGVIPPKVLPCPILPFASLPCLHGHPYFFSLFII
jgi:hypothetical protein